MPTVTNNGEDCTVTLAGVTIPLNSGVAVDITDEQAAELEGAPNPSLVVASDAPAPAPATPSAPTQQGEAE